MTPRPTPHVYRAFGLTVHADIVLPELIPAANAPADVTVALVDRLPDPPPTLHAIGATVLADATDFRIDIPGAGRFRVSHGIRIELCLADGHDAAEVRAYVLGTCIGVALLQRGMMPLHASAVEIDGRAVAFTGASGAGKSTLALALQRREHAVLCDDLCGIGEDRIISPGVVRLKLWQASLDHAGEDSAPLEPVAPGDAKFHLPPGAPVADRAVPLAAIVALQWSEDCCVTVETLRGIDAAQAIVRNTFRGVLIEPMGIAPAHLARCVEIARTIPILRLSRAQRFDQLDAAVDALIAALP